jgi:hypothetical protein
MSGAVILDRWAHGSTLRGGLSPQAAGWGDGESETNASPYPEPLRGSSLPFKGRETRPLPQAIRDPA